MDIGDVDTSITPPNTHFFPFRKNEYKSKTTELGQIRRRQGSNGIMTRTEHCKYQTDARDRSMISKEDRNKPDYCRICDETE